MQLKLKLITLFIFSSIISFPIAIGEERILFLGDSLTEGYGITKDEAFPHLIEQQLKKEGRTDIVVVNGGESGSKTSSAMRRLRWHLRSKPSILVILLGANDGLRGTAVSVIKKNLQELINFAKEKKLKILLVGMQMPPNYGKEYREKFAKIYPELAKENNIPLVPFLLDGVAREKKYNLSDGIHPNAAGHSIMAQTVLKELKKLL